MLEVIAALLLLAIAFGAVMRVAGASMGLNAKAREATRISMWADATIEAAGRRSPLVEGVKEGRYDDHYRWRMTVSSEPVDEPSPGDLHLYRIDLDVLSGERPSEHATRFTVLRAQDEPPPARASSVAGT